MARDRSSMQVKMNQWGNNTHCDGSLSIKGCVVVDGACEEHRLGPSMALFPPSLAQMLLRSSVCHGPNLVQ